MIAKYNQYPNLNSMTLYWLDLIVGNIAYVCRQFIFQETFTRRTSLLTSSLQSSTYHNLKLLILHILPFDSLNCSFANKCSKWRPVRTCWARNCGSIPILDWRGWCRSIIRHPESFFIPMNMVVVVFG